MTRSTAPALAARHLKKSYGGLVATNDLSLEVRPGELHAIIGPNGAGKSTLIGQLAGELRPDSGQILLNGQDVTRLPTHRRARLGLARSYQITSVFPDFTVLENVALAMQPHCGHSFRFLTPIIREPSLTEPARRAIAEARLGERIDTPVANLAHGERRQLELAMSLVGQPAVLLLDEPMAGMSHTESQRVVELLLRLKGRMAILLIEHDMDAVFRVADRISVLVYGAVIACGTAEEIRRNPDVIAAYLGDEEI